jgi:hypothetical protein
MTTTPTPEALAHALLHPAPSGDDLVEALVACSLAASRTSRAVRRLEKLGTALPTDDTRLGTALQEAQAAKEAFDTAVGRWCKATGSKPIDAVAVLQGYLGKERDLRKAMKES